MMSSDAKDRGTHQNLADEIAFPPELHRPSSHLSGLKAVVEFKWSKSNE